MFFLFFFSLFYFSQATLYDSNFPQEQAEEIVAVTELAYLLNNNYAPLEGDQSARIEAIKSQLFGLLKPDATDPDDFSEYEILSDPLTEDSSSEMSTDSTEIVEESIVSPSPEAELDSQKVLVTFIILICSSLLLLGSGYFAWNKFYGMKLTS